MRAKLTMAMLSNVLAALRKSRKISDVTIVSPDKAASRIARRYGAKFLWEGKSRGLNRAVRLAIGKLEQRRAEAAMVVHADLPILTTHDVNEFLSRSWNSDVAIVPCKNGTGTNALLLRPPNVIKPVFGTGSFKIHLSLAKRTKLRWKVLRIRGIQFDIDNDQDLRRFMRYYKRSETFRLLKD
jgi:2-phospho-L-lactate guanylyltransferase